MPVTSCVTEVLKSYTVHGGKNDVGQLMRGLNPHQPRPEYTTATETNEECYTGVHVVPDTSRYTAELSTAIKRHKYTCPEH